MKTKIVTNEDNATFEATREFAADIETVWKAWTTAELLDQWWAPRPWKTETKKMDFREGGAWLYDMVGPAGERHGGMQKYEKIKPNDYFSGSDAFTDPEGNILDNMPVATWKNVFTKTTTGTMVHVTSKYRNAEDLRTVLKMGMSEGFNMALNNLEELLTKK